MTHQKMHWSLLKEIRLSFPCGTSIVTESDIVVGVNWNNVDGNRIDLDLSLIGLGDKFGWDAKWREGDVLFSGDMTNAAHGASELFYVSHTNPGIYGLYLNYFNYNKELPVPFQLFVGQTDKENISLTYLSISNSSVYP